MAGDANFRKLATPLHPIPYGRGDAHTFAHALLKFAEATAEQVPSLVVSMPAFAVSISSDSPDYLKLCRRALVDDPEAKPAETLKLAILDYSTHPEMPRGRWSGESFGLPLLAEGLEESGFKGSLNTDARFLQFYHSATRSGVEALAEPRRYPPWIASFPLRNFLHWAYEDTGRRLIHAGTLSVDGRGVLLSGAGGSGKSGTVLAGILGGLDSAGDDYVVVDTGDRPPAAHPVMRLMKQDAAGLARLGIDPVAQGLGLPNWQNKFEFDFEALGAGRRARVVELGAILLPKIARAARTELVPVKSSAAMASLAPNNLTQLPGGWRKGLQLAAHLARSLPAFELRLSENPREIADTVGAFISGLSR